MTIIVDEKLPAFKFLKKENVFEITLSRAKSQDIRPLEIGILNLMPTAAVERTEIQLLRLLANTPLQINPSLIYFDKHKSGSNQHHFDAFYRTFSEVKKMGLDGLIITGANLEDYNFEDVFYWKELTKFFSWAEKNVTSTIYSCWASHAHLYFKYGIKPKKFKKKCFGIFEHKVRHQSNSPFLQGIDTSVKVPHSRWRGVSATQIQKHKGLEILIENSEVGPHLVVGRKGREIYLQGHPEYDRDDLRKEYERDKKQGIDIILPKNYFPNDNDSKTPEKNWNANAQVFYNNWINWVYQTTNVDIKRPLM